MTTKTACVVGAGPSGIGALKECIRQGFKTKCYELDSEAGGIWNIKNGNKTNTPAIWDTLVTNTSKYNNCYSDLPPDKNETIYMTADRMYSYFQRAIEHYGVRKFIHLNTRVIQIKKASDHEQTGRWEVYTTERGSEIAGNDEAGPRARDEATLSRCHKEVFDFVLVCTGHFKYPTFPDNIGVDTFKGTYQHSFHYASGKPFEGQNVLVVGNKFSAIDVAADLANYTKKVYMALGEGTWILPRCYANSLTYDALLSRSLIHSSDMAVKLNNMLISEAQRNFDHDTSGVRPSKPPVFAGVGLSDDLPLKLMCGKVQAYGRLVRLDGDKAHFKDGRVISGIDSVVCATGFKPDFSFIDLDIIQENGKMELYKMIFPLGEKHNSLGIIGNFGGDFPGFCLYETQARLATRVMAGKHQLPPLSKMREDVDYWNDNIYERTGKYKTYYFAVALFLEKTAQELGCYPSFWKVFMRSPKLAFKIWYGPIFSAQYRLVGPDSDWDSAARTCFYQYEEGCASLQHKDFSSFQRRDKYKHYVSQSINLAVYSAAAVVIGFLLANNRLESLYAAVKSWFV